MPIALRARGMRILVAITTSDTKLVGDRALRWCARLGMDVCLFVPKGKRRKFKEVIDDMNYHYYVDFTYDRLITRMDVEKYAWANEYELLVTVPHDLWSWRKNKQFKVDEIAHPYNALGKARVEFGNHPRKKIKRWNNGVTMERIK